MGCWIYFHFFRPLTFLKKFLFFERNRTGWAAQIIFFSLVYWHSYGQVWLVLQTKWYGLGRWNHQNGHRYIYLHTIVIHKLSRFNGIWGILTFKDRAPVCTLSDRGIIHNLQDVNKLIFQPYRNIKGNLRFVAS